MILNGIGLILLGGAAIAIYFFDEDRQIGLVIAGGICILAGLGSAITGLTGGSDDDDDE
jgi:hypothetical protein